MANNEKLQLALEKDLETVRTSVEEVKKIADAALPSADLTQTKILELIDKLPTKNGGTGAATRKEAFDNLAFLGKNPVSSLEEDTPQKWLELGSGYAKFDEIDLMNDQPEQYMFVINFKAESSAIFQIGSLQSGDGVYYRTGNSNGWTASWTQLYGANNVIPIQKGGTGATTLNNFFAYKGYLTTKDANDMWETGMYRVIGDNINVPGSPYGVLNVYLTEDYTVQIYTSVDKNMGQHISMRTGNRESKTWNPWHLFYTDKEVVPVSNGGTGSNTRNDAFRNLSFLGDKPIASTAQDTTKKWRDLGTGYAWFGINNVMINQPYTYMFVLNYVQGSDVFQIGSTQSDSNTVYFRSGNDSGWYKNWTPLLSYEYSNTDLTAGSSKLATGKVYFVYE